jgi:hypothetical protein
MVALAAVAEVYMAAQLVVVHLAAPEPERTEALSPGRLYRISLLGSAAAPEPERAVAMAAAAEDMA